MLMAQLSSISKGPERTGASVFLNEECARVRLGEEAEPVDAPWYLDTGAPNHMTGNHAVFADLETNIHGTVRFGDNSLVEIKGRGTVLIKIRGGEHHALTDVYYIPQLKTSIISLGQLDENGCPSAIHDGFMSLWDRCNHLLAKVPHSPNRLYKVVLQIA
jgi:hypothetical protein